MVWSLALFGMPLLFCVAPLSAPSWTVWLAVGLLGALTLAWGWVEVWQALEAQPQGNPYGGAVAAGYALLCSAAFASGLGGRALGLILQDRGRRRAEVLWTDALGFAGPMALLIFFWIY